MTGPDRGPLCLTCMGAWELHLGGHEPCRGITIRLGQAVRCRCRCQDGAGAPEVLRKLGTQPAARAVPAVPRRRSCGPPPPPRLDRRLL